MTDWSWPGVIRAADCGEAIPDGKWTKLTAHALRVACLRTKQAVGFSHAPVSELATWLPGVPLEAQEPFGEGEPGRARGALDGSERTFGDCNFA